MTGALATRYAHALVDVVTRPGAEVTPEEATAQLGSFVAVLRASADLRNVLISPAVSPPKKKGLILELARRLDLSRTIRNFLFVVTDHRRLELLDEMLSAVGVLLDERLGIARAEATVAQPMSPEQQSALAAGLGDLTGKQVRLRLSVDPALLGGVVVRLGSTVYDGSVRGQLHILERRLATEDLGS